VASVEMTCCWETDSGPGRAEVDEEGTCCWEAARMALDGSRQPVRRFDHSTSMVLCRQVPLLSPAVLPELSPWSVQDARSVGDSVISNGGITSHRRSPL